MRFSRELLIFRFEGGFEDKDFMASNDIFYSSFSDKAKLMTIELGSKKK